MLEAVYCQPWTPLEGTRRQGVITSLKTEEKHQRQGEIPPSLFFSYFVSKLRLEMNSYHFMAPNYVLQVPPHWMSHWVTGEQYTASNIRLLVKKRLRIHYNSQFCVPLPSYVFLSCFDGGQDWDPPCPGTVSWFLCYCYDGSMRLDF